MEVSRFLVLFVAIFFNTHIIKCNSKNIQSDEYSFKIDYAKNQFLLDSNPFRYVSESFHYFRVPRQFWLDKLREMKAAGFNAVTTYVEWSLHQPEINQWNWEGNADLKHFINLVQEEDLLLILRLRPYICAEKDSYGIPNWLLHHIPDGKLQTDDEDYMRFVKIYYESLFQRIQPHLRGSGGPIIIIQVENECGSYNTCDKSYMRKLIELLKSYVGDKAVLDTKDCAPYNWLKSGNTPGAYATVEFGTGSDVLDGILMLRTFSPQGLFVHSESYPGWLAHWTERLQNTSSEKVVSKLAKLLASNASVNFNVFNAGMNSGQTRHRDKAVSFEVNKIIRFERSTEERTELPPTETVVVTEKDSAVATATAEVTATATATGGVTAKATATAGVTTTATATAGETATTIARGGTTATATATGGIRSSAVATGGTTATATATTLSGISAKATAKAGTTATAKATVTSKPGMTATATATATAGRTVTQTLTARNGESVTAVAVVA